MVMSLRPEQRSHFGVHMTLDGYNGCSARLGDFDYIARFLRDLPAQLSMHSLMDPTLIEVGELSPKDPGGITGFVLIAESHISIHTFPLRRFLSADVYTCQNALDQQRIKDHFAGAFVLEDVETNYLIRGTRYPRANMGHAQGAERPAQLLVRGE